MNAFEANAPKLKIEDPQVYYALLDFKDSLKHNQEFRRLLKLDYMEGE